MDWTVIRISRDQYAQLSALAQSEGRTAPAQLRAVLGERFKQAGEVEAAGQTGAGVAQPAKQAARDGSHVAGSNPVPGPQSSSRPTPAASTSSHKSSAANPAVTSAGPKGRIGAPLAAHPKRERKSTCEHRVPPGSYCGRCDA